MTGPKSSAPASATITEAGAVELNESELAKVDGGWIEISDWSWDVANRKIGQSQVAPKGGAAIQKVADGSV